MKKCNKCDEDKPDTDFYSNGINRFGEIRRKYTCKECMSKDRTARFRKIVKDFFGEMRCIKCGFEGHHSQFDCHHRNPKEKSFSIGQARQSRLGRDKVISELKKCDLLCANCHRLMHIKS